VSANAINERERQLVQEFFAGASDGFFVEVGANDPYERSQTWHLEQTGWTGILIEPQPELAEKLRQARKAKVYAVACSSSQNAGGVLPLHVAGPLSSLDRERMAPGTQLEAIIDVPIRTLDQILQEAGAPAGFDFLSLDVEGHELEVLQGFDLKHWQPRLILLEDHVGSLAKHRFLTRGGYRLIRRFDNNGWYVPADAANAVSWRERWNILRKYYLALPLRMARNLSRDLRRRARISSQRSRCRTISPAPYRKL
jgi:FkbM family methyltransferase